MVNRIKNRRERAEGICRIASPELSGDVHFTALRIARERGVFAGSVPEAELVEFAGGTGDVVRALWEAIKIFLGEKRYCIDLVAKAYRLSPADAERWTSSVRYSRDGVVSRPALEEASTALLASQLIHRPIDVETIVADGFAPVRL